MMVLSDEIIGMVKSYLKGIRTEKEDLALDIIDKVQPGGNFLAEEHTLVNFRKFWFPNLFNRSMNSVDSKEFRFTDNLAKRTKDLINSHKPLSLSKEVRTELEKIERHIVKKRK